MLARWAGCAAALLTVGLVAGCGGLWDTRTEFTPGTAQRVSMAQTSLTLQVGSQERLTATAFDSRGTELPEAVFAWSSFNPAVATVNEATGVVTAVGAGATSVTAAHSSGMLARATVTVTAGPVVLSFNTDIKPIATLGCSCHQSGGSAAQTGSMADLANLLAKSYVTAGDPANSPFLVNGSGGASHPAGDALGANKQKVSDWIEQGAKP